MKQQQRLCAKWRLGKKLCLQFYYKIMDESEWNIENKTKNNTQLQLLFLYCLVREFLCQHFCLYLKNKHATESRNKRGQKAKRHVKYILYYSSWLLRKHLKFFSYASLWIKTLQFVLQKRPKAERCFLFSLINMFWYLTFQHYIDFK